MEICLGDVVRNLVCHELLCQESLVSENNMYPLALLPYILYGDEVEIMEPQVFSRICVLV